MANQPIILLTPPLQHSKNAFLLANDRLCEVATNKFHKAFELLDNCISTLQKFECCTGTIPSCPLLQAEENAVTPESADLLITVVRKPDGEGHAVLTVRTQSGDFVLDNLNDEVKLWTETRYAFLKRQSSTDTGRWVTIENGTSDVLVGALQ